MLVKLFMQNGKSVREKIIEIEDSGDIYVNIASVLGRSTMNIEDPLWFMSRKGCIRFEKITKE